MTKPPSILSLIIALVVLAVFGFFGARFMLNKHSASTQERLGAVWPAIATMPAQDRDFLVELALTCNVAARQQAPAEVIACLRSVPMNADAAARLERLLGQAPRR